MRTFETCVESCAFLRQLVCVIEMHLITFESNDVGILWKKVYHWNLFLQRPSSLESCNAIFCIDLYDDYISKATAAAVLLAVTGILFSLEIDLLPDLKG